MRHPRTVLLPLLIASLLLTGCGISLSGDETTTEMFRGISISGDLAAGRRVSLDVRIKDAYPIPVRVACFYEDRSALTPEQRRVPFHERAIPIGETILPATDAPDPGADVPVQTLSFPFSVPEPGTYFGGCLSPASPDNGVSLSFEIRPVDAAGR